ncbi:MAG: EAL domain-containing protein [Actinomycetota bacterium]
MRRIDPRVAWAYLLVGLVVAFSCALSEPHVADIIYLVTLAQVTLVMALVVPRVIKVPTSFVVLAWLTSVFFTAAQLVTMTFDTDPTTRFIAQTCSLLGELVIVYAVANVIRRQGHLAGLDVLGDATILALGVWLVLWITVLRPSIDAWHGSMAPNVLESVSESIGSVIVLLFGVLLVTSSRRNVAMCILAVSASALMVGGMIGGLVGARRLTASAASVADGVSTIAAFGLVAAFLHPSVAKRVEARPPRPSQHLLSRMVLSTTALAVPTLLLALTTVHNSTDRAVRTASATVLVLAVTARIVEALRRNMRSQEQLISHIKTDDLTGLPARRAVLDRLTELATGPTRTDKPVTVYFLDLDRFRAINDSLGHEAGDDVLRTVAYRLTSVAPTGSMVARLSGDEFVLVDPVADSADDAARLAELLLSVFAEPITLHQGDVFLTASIGIASMRPGTTRVQNVLRNADTAMYRAKDSGRNGYAFYDDSMREQISHRLSIETSLYRALDRRELQLFHQPILDVETGLVTGFEALMRWRLSDGTTVSPVEFIPIAEETGTIVPIGAWAMNDALSQLREWIDQGVCSPNATMSVNVSPRQLADPELTSMIADALNRAGLPPSALWVEITETVMISNAARALATMQQLRALGVRIALDDFGTGYSSLSMLQRFPVQRLKIDRAFVNGVADNDSDQALVRAVIAMAKSMELDLVGEGVETLAQVQTLWSMGCSKVQGYLISHPVPADAVRSTVMGLERVGRQPLLRDSLVGARV